MTFWFRKHHYKTQFKHTLGMFIHWYNIKGFIRALWNGEKYVIWFSHQDDCCDYWTPINDPKAIRALMLDDELGLTPPTTEKQVIDNDYLIGLNRPSKPYKEKE